jgi:hypothetical protein
VSVTRLIVIAIVVMASGSVLALVLDHGERGRTSTKTVTVAATATVTATTTVTQAAPASGPTTPAEPEIPDSTEAGFEVHWKGRLRLNETGHSLDGDDDPSPDGSSYNVYIDYEGNIDFDDVTVAEWSGSSTPRPSECVAQVKTQSFSSNEASDINPKKGLQLCLSLVTEDKSTRIGFMRVLPGFTVDAVNVQGVLWDKLL